jgi:hypothetical protein
MLASFNTHSAWETGNLHTEIWWGSLRERDHLEDLGVDGRIILKKVLLEVG